MISRRDALTLMAALLTRNQPQAQTTTCRQPERQVIDFGAGACRTHELVVKQGALIATIPIADVMTALGARVG